MPAYIAKTRTIALRIVYDGLGTAGKTTNVRKLHELYTLRREGPVLTPEVVHGRTAFFDWLELEAGTLDGGFPLRCQVLTVPGQFAYAARRWQLLEKPDAIVCVCDTSEGGMRRSRVGLDFLRELRARGVCTDVPIVVQANKRDLPDAVPIDDVRRELGLGADDHLVEASAHVGDGVQLTFYRALDAARERLRGLLLGGLSPKSLPAPESPDDLLARLRLELSQDEAFELVEHLDLERRPSRGPG